jgi:hypothetical protein
MNQNHIKDDVKIRLPLSAILEILEYDNTQHWIQKCEQYKVTQYNGAGLNYKPLSSMFRVQCPQTFPFKNKKREKRV